MCGKHCVATATHTPLLIVIWLFSDCHITIYAVILNFSEESRGLRGGGRQCKP